MMKVEIILDEDKIRAEGEYEVEEIRRCVFNPFERGFLRKLETTDNSIAYCDNGKKNDYAYLWRANAYLVQKEWFIRYVKKWIWTDEDEKEDIVESFSRNRVGAYA